VALQFHERADGLNSNDIRHSANLEVHVDGGNASGFHGGLADQRSETRELNFHLGKRRPAWPAALKHPVRTGGKGTLESSVFVGDEDRGADHYSAGLVVNGFP